MYDRFDLDLAKVMNDYAYPLPEGLDRIRNIDDWKRLKPLKATEGGFAEQLKLLEKVAKHVKKRRVFCRYDFRPFLRGPPNRQKYHLRSASRAS